MAFNRNGFIKVAQRTGGRYRISACIWTACVRGGLAQLRSGYRVSLSIRWRFFLNVASCSARAVSFVGTQCSGRTRRRFNSKEPDHRRPKKLILHGPSSIQRPRPTHAETLAGHQIPAIQINFGCESAAVEQLSYGGWCDGTNYRARRPRQAPPPRPCPRHVQLRYKRRVPKLPRWRTHVRPSARSPSR